MNKEIAYEIARDIVERILKLLCKASYPISGNLSNNVQTKLEGLLGREYYDAKKAFGTSLIINIGIYLLSSVVFTLYMYNKTLKLDSLPNLGLHVILLSLILIIAEGRIRTRISEDNQKNVNGIGVSASLVGKIISIPFDMATICSDYYYHDIGNYLRRIENRIKNREGGDKNEK